jgi:phytoene dehydrogenase-like protein
MEAEVRRILVDGYACRGVQLTTGEEIGARGVISGADPKRTFLSLVKPVNLPPEFVWQVQSLKMRGSVSKLHLLTDGTHGMPEGTVALAPSIRYLEQAYDAAKYGRISEKPYLEVTTLGNVVSIHIQYTPYALKASDWDEEGRNLEDLALKALAPLFPKLKSSILDSKLLTPTDLEAAYGLTEGDLNHGQLSLDQFLFMRPLPGWSNQRTPIDNLFLCGSGVHGGGGISGAAGRNAAKAVLAESFSARSVFARKGL